METQDRYKTRLYEHIDKYCKIKKREREIEEKQEFYSDLCFTIAFIVFMAFIGSLEYIADLISSLFGG